MQERPLKRGGVRQPLGTSLGIEQLLVVGCDSRSQTRLKTFVDAALLAALDHSREAEEDGDERHHREKHEIDDEPASEAGHSVPFPPAEG